MADYRVAKYGEYAGAARTMKPADVFSRHRRERSECATHVHDPRHRPEVITSDAFGEELAKESQPPRPPALS